MNKILFVVDERKMGGVSVLLEDILKMGDFSNKSIDILVLHNNGEMFENLPQNINIIYGTEFFDIIDIPFKSLIKSLNIKKIIKKITLFFYLKTGLIKHKILKERKKILKFSYDVEIAFKDGFPVIFTAYGDSSKKISWLHSSYKTFDPTKKYRGLFNKILSNIDVVVAVSEDTLKSFIQIYDIKCKTIVVPNIVNTDRIIKNSKENSDWIKDENFLNFVSVGRLHIHKGYDQLISALHKLKLEKKLENIKVTIFGDGPEKENLNNLIKDFGLENHVILYGYVSNPYKYIKDSDLFILPSRSESFGLVIVESLTLGVPVISTLNDATESLISQGENGLIVENSIEGLYNGLSQVIDNLSILNEFKENLKNYKYGNDKSINLINDLINDDK